MNLNEYLYYLPFYTLTYSPSLDLMLLIIIFIFNTEPILAQEQNLLGYGTIVPQIVRIVLHKFVTTSGEAALRAANSVMKY